MAEEDAANVDAEQGASEPLTGAGGDGAATPSVVTFTTKAGTPDGKSADATIDIAVVPSYPGQGLSKSEVMAYANDPTWKKVRMGSFIAFWIVWLGLLGASVAIVMTGSCTQKPSKD